MSFVKCGQKYFFFTSYSHSGFIIIKIFFILTLLPLLCVVVFFVFCLFKTWRCSLRSLEGSAPFIFTYFLLFLFFCDLIAYSILFSDYVISLFTSWYRYIGDLFLRNWFKLLLSPEFDESCVGGLFVESMRFSLTKPFSLIS